MDLIYPPESEHFRAELRSWLEANLSPEDYDDNARTPNLTGRTGSRAWARKLHEAGYASIGWPTRFGGRDAGAIDQLVFTEEMQRVGAPSPPNFTGVTRIGPALMRWGTEKQQEHYLPRILRADDLWCQGFSEPDAGSDLASLRTKAVNHGDVLVVSGQKVWTSGADTADYCELLVRTDPALARHKGISCLLVDMRLEGIEVRPIVTLTGDTGFSQVFLDDVRVPSSCMLGPLNQGWAVTRTTLAHERASVADFHPRLRQEIQDVVELSRVTDYGERRASQDPIIRQRLARLYVHGEALKLIADRMKVAILMGEEPNVEGNLSRLVWGPLTQEIPEVSAEILQEDGAYSHAGRARAGSRGATIAGGTNQIQKNIIAERGLGLPRSY
jgi:alkylation response protein AidB-like acyl-CoA dehydrogenase